MHLVVSKRASVDAPPGPNSRQVFFGILKAVHVPDSPYAFRGKYPALQRAQEVTTVTSVRTPSAASKQLAVSGIFTQGIVEASALAIL